MAGRPIKNGRETLPSAVRTPVVEPTFCLRGQQKRGHPPPMKRKPYVFRRLRKPGPWPQIREGAPKGLSLRNVYCTFF